MRWAITTACLIVAVIGVALLAQAQSVDVDRLPPGGRSILYIGVVIAWGFAGVGAFAHSRRPENHTGALMVLVGAFIALTALQFFDQPVLFSIGASFDTICIAALIHLLLAFPTGRVEGRWARSAMVAAYVAGVLQLPALLVNECPECPNGNPMLIERERRQSRRSSASRRDSCSCSRSSPASSRCCAAARPRARSSAAASSRSCCSVP